MEKLNVFLNRMGITLPEEIILRITHSGRNYFLCSEKLTDVKNYVTKDIYSIGIFLGEEKNDFIPSPAFIEMLSSLPESDKNKIFTNKKAEWLFLCGRSILAESMKNPNNISSGNVFVQNEKNENIGYGFFKQEGKDLVVRNLVDKGKYLRMD